MPFFYSSGTEDPKTCEEDPQQWYEDWKKTIVSNESDNKLPPK